MENNVEYGNTPISVLAGQVYDYLADKGYKPKGINRIRKIWNHFARYANDCPFTLDIGIAFLRDAYGIEWSEYPPPMKRFQRRSLGAIRYLRDYEQYGKIGIHRRMKPPYVWPEQFRELIESFTKYVDEAGYSKDYLRGVIREIHKLLVFLSECDIQQINIININSITEYIKQNYNNMCVNTIKTRIGHIRLFLKFIYLNGFSECDLREQLPIVRQFRMGSLPNVWDNQRLDKFLAAIDRTTSDGKRDYVIFLLAINLGLRIGDILNLQFCNINWSDSSISISQTKTDELLSMPMSMEVGWAIIEYLKNGRPQTKSKYLFIRHCAPYQAFGINNNFHYKVRKYIELAGITPPSDKFYGIHSMRHSFAARLLEAETPLPLISEMLGHKGSSATPIYLKVADEKLRICALNPEVEVNGNG